MKTTTPHRLGFTLLEIMIVVSIIAALLVIAIPCFVRARAGSQQATCINNLRQVRSAILQWGLETKASETTPVQFSDIQSYMRGTVICPSGGTSFSDSYSIIDVKTMPTCRQAPATHTIGPDLPQ